MALKAFISNFRSNRKVSQEINNAGQTNQTRTRKLVIAPAFVLAFTALLTSLTNIGSRVSATDASFTLPAFNFTPIGTMLGSLLDAGTVVATPFQNFLNAWVGPAIEVIVVVAVIFLIATIFIIGPAKVIGAIEKLIEEITRKL